MAQPSAGAVIFAPTASIRPSRITTVACSIGAPETGTTRASCNTHVPFAGAVGACPRRTVPSPPASAVTASQSVEKRLLISVVLLLEAQPVTVDECADPVYWF